MLRENYQISTNKRRLDVALIHDFLRSTYWAKDIPRSVVERSIRNSLCFGVFHRGKQIGFARVITDRATLAYLADVFVVPKHRGHGVGRMLIARILAHRDLQGLRRILLATHDAHGLYASFGFKPLAHPERFMTIARPGVYQKKVRHPIRVGRPAHP
jgi:GNAT superfamily N-acetyltransferase